MLIDSLIVQNKENRDLLYEWIVVLGSSYLKIQLSPKQLRWLWTTYCLLSNSKDPDDRQIVRNIIHSYWSLCLKIDYNYIAFDYTLPISCQTVDLRRACNNHVQIALLNKSDLPAFVCAICADGNMLYEAT